MDIIGSLRLGEVSRGKSVDRKRGQLSEPWSHSVHGVWRDERTNQMDKGQSEVILEAK